jgi:hypothetical protein
MLVYESQLPCLGHCLLVVLLCFSIYIYYFIFEFLSPCILWLDPVVKTFDLISMLVPLFFDPWFGFWHYLYIFSLLSVVVVVFYVGVQISSPLCVYFAFLTTLYYHLRGPRYLFDQFLTFYLYFCTVSFILRLWLESTPLFQF